MGTRQFLIDRFLDLRKDRRLHILKELNRTFREDYATVSEWQFNKIVHLLKYSYRHIPFYKKWFDIHGVNPNDIKDYNDFSSKIPVLTKSDIIKDIDLFTNNGSKVGRKIFFQSTGGSTGQTLKFRMSAADHEMGSGLLLRGMGHGGYRLGDKILILAGGSLVSKTPSIKTLLISKLYNQYKVSSYGLQESDFERITKLISKENIKFLRGYASAIYLLADFCKAANLQLQLHAIFSTSEVLLDNQRALIEATFGCKVFNQYGLNDGGVSAFQYTDDNSLVIDVERGYMEIDHGSDQNAIANVGPILATSFLNLDFPFIRYDTGDIGEFSYRYLGRIPDRPRIVKLLGRETEFLQINGKKIASPVLTVLMGQTNAEQYSIIQKSNGLIQINIKKGRGYNEKDTDFIRKSLFEHCGKFDLKFHYVDKFSNANKHKFIIRE